MPIPWVSPLNQCCGSMTFWCGSWSWSGSADACLWLTDPDPDSDADLDPDIFVIDLRDANKKIFKKKFFCLLLFEGTFTPFFKDKKSKRSHKAVGIKVFLLFLLGDRRIQIQETQKHTDPDPHHSFKLIICINPQALGPDKGRARFGSQHFEIHSASVANSWQLYSAKWTAGFGQLVRQQLTIVQEWPRARRLWSVIGGHEEMSNSWKEKKNI